LIDNIRQKRSTSLVGEYRIGTSWLMQHLQQIAPTHPQLGPLVRIGILDVYQSQCQTLKGFVKETLKVLNMPVHHPNSYKEPLERLSIEVRAMRQQNIILVLFIDKFADLIGKRGFDKSFVTQLRAILEHDGLVLITASGKPLHTVIEHITGGTSPLFNIMPELILQPFTEAEAKAFISTKGQQSSLSGDEQAFFREQAAISQANGELGWPPLRLQLTGQLLLKDKSSRALALSDPAYRADFKKRLDDEYQRMVKH
jgi:conflict system STAND superfamily ATPase